MAIILLKSLNLGANLVKLWDMGFLLITDPERLAHEKLKVLSKPSHMNTVFHDFSQEIPSPYPEM